MVVALGCSADKIVCQQPRMDIKIVSRMENKDRSIPSQNCFVKFESTRNCCKKCLLTVVNGCRAVTIVEHVGCVVDGWELPPPPPPAPLAYSSPPGTVQSGSHNCLVTYNQHS